MSSMPEHQPARSRSLFAVWFFSHGNRLRNLGPRRSSLQTDVRGRAVHYGAVGSCNSYPSWLPFSWYNGLGTLRCAGIQPLDFLGGLNTCRIGARRWYLLRQKSRSATVLLWVDMTSTVSSSLVRLNIPIEARLCRWDTHLQHWAC